MNPKKLTRDSRILSISHWDFDGVTCSIVLANYFKNIKCISCTFTNVDSIIEKTNLEDYDAIFVTDCFPKQVETLDSTDKIIILDHHQGSKKIFNPEKNIYSIDGVCGALLTKNWVEETYNINLNHLNDLVRYANDYDLWIHNWHKSRFINELFWKMGDTKFRMRFMNGDVRFTPQELSFFRQRRKEFFETYDKLLVFEFEKINACFVPVTQFLNDIADRLLYKDGYELVLVQNARSKHISVRSKSDDVNLGKIINDLNLGGGHGKAAAFNNREGNIEKLKESFQVLEDYIYENYPQWRK